MSKHNFAVIAYCPASPGKESELHTLFTEDLEETAQFISDLRHKPHQQKTSWADLRFFEPHSYEFITLVDGRPAELTSPFVNREAMRLFERLSNRVDELFFAKQESGNKKEANHG